MEKRIFLGVWVVAASTLAIGSLARADGFVCQVATGDLRVKIYNQVNPNLGTRNPAAMILSNPLHEKGRRTIARFDAVTQRLSGRSAQYDAEVDLRFKDSDRKGEYVGGTRLGYLDRIELDVDFNFSQPVDAGVILGGELRLIKRDGQVLTHSVSCERYLKGE